MKQKNVVLLMLLLLSSLSAACQVTTDNVYLKDGRVLKGTITKKERGEYVKLLTSSNSDSVSYCNISALSSTYDVIKDVVYLKDGSIVRGAIIKEVPGQYIRVRTDSDCEFLCYNNNIESVGKDISTIVWKETRDPQYYIHIETKKFCHFVDFLLYGFSNSDFGGSISLLTSHGIQVLPYLFTGIGLGVDYTPSFENKISMPIFADFRVYPLKNNRYLNRTKATPEIGAQIGYSPIGKKGFFGSYSIGAKFFAPRLAIDFNAAVVYTMRTAEQSDHRIGLKLGIDF